MAAPLNTATSVHASASGHTVYASEQTVHVVRGEHLDACTRAQIGKLWEDVFPFDPSHKQSLGTPEQAQAAMGTAATDKLVLQGNLSQYAQDIFFFIRSISGAGDSAGGSVGTAEESSEGVVGENAGGRGAGEVIAAARLRAATCTIIQPSGSLAEPASPKFPGNAGTASSNAISTDPDTHTEGPTFAVLGISDVACSETHRRRGLGATLVRAIRQYGTQQPASDQAQQAAPESLQAAHGDIVVPASAAQAPASIPAVVGFCAHANAGFYAKCGFAVLEGAALRFVYARPLDGCLLVSPYDDDVFVTPGHVLTKAVQAAPQSRVVISRSHW